VDLERFHPQPPDSALRKSLGLGSQGPLIGAVTFLRPEKGMSVLIEAVGRLKKRYSTVECAIIGDGGEKPALLDRIRKLGLEQCVHLVGFRQDVPSLLALLDVVVIPSFEEGIPQSLTQALAMERPVVASAVGGVPEVVEDGVMFLGDCYYPAPRYEEPTDQMLDMALLANLLDENFDHYIDGHNAPMQTRHVRRILRSQSLLARLNGTRPTP